MSSWPIFPTEIPGGGGGLHRVGAIWRVCFRLALSVTPPAASPGPNAKTKGKTPLASVVGPQVHPTGRVQLWCPVDTAVRSTRIEDGWVLVFFQVLQRITSLFLEQFQTSCAAFGGPSPCGLSRGGRGVWETGAKGPPPTELQWTAGPARYASANHTAAPPLSLGPPCRTKKHGPPSEMRIMPPPPRGGLPKSSQCCAFLCSTLLEDAHAKLFCSYN